MDYIYRIASLITEDPYIFLEEDLSDEEIFTRIQQTIVSLKLRKYVGLSGNVLTIQSYRIPLQYKDGMLFSRKPVFFLAKLYNYMEKLKSKYYSTYSTVTPEKYSALQDLILKVIFPKNKIREIAAADGATSRGIDISTAVDAYSKLQGEQYADQMSTNIAQLYLEIKRRAAQVGQYNADNKLILAAEDLKPASHPLDILNTALIALATVPDFKFDKSGLRIFNKIVVKSKEYNFYKVVIAQSLAIHSETAKHVDRIYAGNNTSLTRNLVHFFRDRPASQTSRRLADWVVMHPKAKANIITDTITMAQQQNVPLNFLDGDEKALQRQHDQLMERANAGKASDVYNHDILETKTLGDLELKYLGNALELTVEGQKMHHCVGSYGDRCKSGQCAVYGVYVNGKHTATLELGGSTYDHVITPSNMRMQQLRGPSNSGVKPEVSRAVRRLIAMNAKPEEDGQLPDAAHGFDGDDIGPE